MKTSFQKGFVIPLVIAIVVILIAGGVYLYQQKITGIKFVDVNGYKITSATSQPSITILSPNGAENWYTGDTQQIRWSSTLSSQSTVDISLVDTEYATYCANYGPDCNHSPTYTIKSGIPNTGMYAWNTASLPDNIGLKNTYDGQYLIRVCPHGVTDLRSCGQSKAPFNIKMVLI